MQPVVGYGILPAEISDRDGWSATLGFSFGGRARRPDSE